MQARGIILAVMALVFAAGVMLLGRAWMTAQTPVAAAPAAAPAFAILVARDQMTLGQIIKPTDLVWQNWPEGDINKAYIAQGTHAPADFGGWVVRSPLGKGEPVTDDKIVAPGDRGFFAAVLRTGMRAVSIAVDSTSGIAGFVFPGDQVDVLLTHNLPAEGSGPHRATETILQDVRVIAIDQKVSNQPAEPTVAHNVTVEVTPKQSEIIAVSTSMGKLSLSLRGIARQPEEAPDADQAASAPGVNRMAQTYTLDNQASRLLGAADGFGALRVTVLHGAKTEEVGLGSGGGK
jgi:pilus assembly protein CpaB